MVNFVRLKMREYLAEVGGAGGEGTRTCTTIYNHNIVMRPWCE